MGRPIRFIPSGSLVEITTRTLHERFLLTPTPLLREVTLGVLGRAQRLFGVEIHAFIFLSNHYHLLASVKDALQLARFVGYLNSNLAREAGRIHHWRQRFWARRYQAIVVTDEPEAQEERLLYLLRNGCKEGLVSSPEDWPGATCVQGLLAGEPLVGRWFDRTAERRAGRSASGTDRFLVSECVELSPLPCWRSLSHQERRRRLERAVDLAREEAAARMLQTGRKPLGAVALSRQPPHASPLASARRPAPLVHAASAAARHAFRYAYRQFVLAFRRAVARLSVEPGVQMLDREFPRGCFRPPPAFVRPALA